MQTTSAGTVWVIVLQNESSILTQQQDILWERKKKSSENISCSGALWKHLQELPHRGKHTFACRVCTVRQANICTAVTCTDEHEHNHPQFTTDSAVPRRLTRVPETKYLQTYFFFISIFISHSVCFCLRLCRRACAGACMYFVRAACWDGELNSKCIWSAKHSRANTQNETHTNTHMRARTHTEACIQHQNHFRHRIYS